jgi:hypothetical protein
MSSAIYRSTLSLTCILLACLYCGASSAGEFSVERIPDGVAVKLDGALFTNYLVRSGKKPVLWPIIGPTGKPMTRAYPMDGSTAITEDQKDHLHHRSLWFSHGKVNGVDLWSEGPRSGSTEHREFVEIAGGKTAKIETTNDWLDQNSKKIAEDRRTLIFSVDGESRIIDFAIVIRANAGKVELGDTKEGTFAIRVPDEISVTAKKGGRIVNSEGLKDQAAWGRPAAWVDYHGPMDGKILGIAILNHPSSYRFPTYWHVRDYGLFAANPFGSKAFSGDSSKNGNIVIKDGDSLQLRFRVVLHQGDEIVGKISERFSEYSKLP